MLVSPYETNFFTMVELFGHSDPSRNHLGLIGGLGRYWAEF
jgi:hypothetical protein